MFSNPLARHRRNRRRSHRATTELRSLIGPDEMLDALSCWGASMPWAVELPDSTPGNLGCRFVIDCLPLGCREPWFAVTAYGTELEDGPEVVVVLPRSIARRGVDVGWAETVAEVDECCSITAVALPTTSQELSALQGLLEVAYSAAFDRAE